MAEVEARLEEFGLVLPERLEASPGLRLPFSWVRLRGSRVYVFYVSGHSALIPDGLWRDRSVKWGRRCLPSRATRQPG